MTITVYSFEDASGNESGDTMTDFSGANQHTWENKLKLIANHYEYVDQELVEDYTAEAELVEDYTVAA